MNSSLMKHVCTATLVLALCSAAGSGAQTVPASNHPRAGSASESAGLLSAADLQKLIPATVFFRGQSSTVQYRNAGGVRLGGGAILFAVKVDTGGYSTSIQERYQDYFISEVPVQFADHTLPAGAYGLGFVGPNLLVLDLGGNTVFSVPSGSDANLRRPRPLQIVSGSAPATYRLYSGKQYVDFKPVPAGK